MFTQPIIVATMWSPRICVSKSMGRVYCGSLFVLDEEGEGRHTTPISKVEGNIITTRSGTMYQLEGDLSPLMAHPFYLTDGTVFPEGREVAPVPPDQGAGLDELTAFFEGRCLVLLYDDGDYETHPLDRLEWAKKRLKPNPGRIYLNGVEVTNLDAVPLVL